MNLYKYILVILVIKTIPIFAQNVDKDSIPNKSVDSLSTNWSDYRISSDAIDTPIEHGSRDSAYFDVQNKIFHLYGDAYVNYQTMSINANYIRIDFNKNIAYAEPTLDSVGNEVGIPQFKDKDQEFKAKKLSYNFKTRKGIIYDVTSKQKDLFIHGEKTKFISKLDEDPYRTNDIIYSHNALFTTCNLDHPHFGIRSNKQKVIPDKLIVVGPSNLEIADIPTPVWLPFGFFPISKKSTQGFIIPRDYEYSERLGYGIKNLGYYVPINDHLDVTLLSSFYLRGTWSTSTTLNYNKRYLFKGNLTTTIGQVVQEIDGTTDLNKTRTFELKWNHSQDDKSHPTLKLSGSANIQTNNTASLTRNDATSVLQNTLNSNVTISKIFPNKPYNLGMTIRHTQNTRTREMTLVLPQVNFNVNQLYPFKIKDRVGKEKWFEQIAFKYEAETQNQIKTTDSTFFNKSTWEKSNFGLKQNFRVNTNIRALKYINLTPFVNFDETWYLKSINKTFDPEIIINLDTIYNSDSSDFVLKPDTTFGKINIDTISKFSPIHNLNVGVSAGTQIFGTLQLKKGWFRGVRHIVKPSISLNYAPDYKVSPFNYYDYVVNDSRADKADTILYSHYENAIYGSPSSSGKSFALGYSINNIFEAKFRNKKDTADTKLKLLETFNISGNYNFAADSLKFSSISVNGNTKFFNGITTVQLNASFDPYKIDSLGRRVNTFYYESDKKLLRFEYFTTSINSNLSFSRIREMIIGKDQKEAKTINTEKLDNLSDLFNNFSINHLIKFDFRRLNTGKDTFYISSNTINIRGSIPISPNWRITFGNIGYDFRQMKISYPDLGFYRSLHCWEMGMDWQPTRRSYTFFLRVTPSTLGFINIPYRKNQYDGSIGF